MAESRLLNLIVAAGRPAGLAAARRPRRARAGFTLIEVVVAVGAVALVAVGLASIFDSVGKTLSGGRRVSALSNYALLLEHNMRRDFETMSRDGFLVIRNQWVDADQSGDFDYTADALPLHAEQPAANRRARRIDEIVFFSRDDFASVRPPLSPEVVTSSDVAMIYYGHSQRRRENLAANSVYLRPRLDDDNATPDAGDPAEPPILGVVQDPNDPAQIAANPNYYPAGWTLARTQTLLAKPQSAAQRMPGGPVFGFDPVADRPMLEDKDTQMGLQPAAASIFRSVNRLTPVSGYEAQSLWREDNRYTNTSIPALSSGVVDVVTTDLNEIRAWITGAGYLQNPNNPPSGTNVVHLFPWSSQLPSRINAPTLTALEVPTGAAPNLVDKMHAWMSDAFPTDSRPPSAFPAFEVAREVPGVRLRSEGETPDLLGVHRAASNSAALALDQAVKRADQLMLLNSGFVPRCSEFIVEWSFGFTVRDPASPANGELIWYGLNRAVDSNDNGDFTDEVLQARPYVGPWDNTNPQYVYSGRTIAAPGATPGVWTHPVTPRVIYGYNPAGNELALTSYFGYIDPTFDPDLNGVPNDQIGDAAVSSIPWAWPKLIRVTVTLSDPQDPEIESTFQFVFSAPDAPNVN